MDALLPKSTKAIVLKHSSTESKPVYHDAVLEERPIPPLKDGEILVRMGAVGFNHRDVWLRKGLYPGLAFDAVLGADGAGTVVASSDPDDPLLEKRVFLTPMRGWDNHPEAPESNFGVLGGVRYPSIGTFSTYVTVSRNEVIPTPEHLDDVQAAAWPLGGVTAWRAVVVNAQVEQGQNVLITGIGGGVALLAMQICIGLGARVWVTSGSKDKVEKAIEFGAQGGVSYKDEDWPVQLGVLLAKGEGGGLLDSIIDSAGGDILTRTKKILKQGGRVVCYGMTAVPKITFTMSDVLQHKKLIGSTMGSRQDLVDATNFLAEHQIAPIISHVFDGLESTEKGFEVMRHGDQFGKIVLRLTREGYDSGNRKANL